MITRAPLHVQTRVTLAKKRLQERINGALVYLSETHGSWSWQDYHLTAKVEFDCINGQPGYETILTNLCWYND